MSPWTRIGECQLPECGIDFGPLLGGKGCRTLPEINVIPSFELAGCMHNKGGVAVQVTSPPRLYRQHHTYIGIETFNPL